jgi:arylsulfatase A-like enzyme
MISFFSMRSGLPDFRDRLLHRSAGHGIWLLAVMFTFVPSFSAQGQDPSRRPNIVFILTDDQGYGDLSCHGNPILKTPHLDALHARSVRFRDYHVSPTCAPTRAALFTGRHEFRSGVTHTINERERLSLQAFTLAQLLKQAGYLTGIFGKWHLGDEADHQPGQRGFDEVFIHGGGGIGQTYPGSCGDAPGNRYFDPAILHNGRFEKTRGYCTDLFFDEALRWIDGKRKDSSPFFCWIATNAPHLPLQVPARYEALYTGKTTADGKAITADEAKFFGMIANIDDNVGKLVARLKEWNLEENTIVVFMTDNGGTVGTRVFNAGMRGMKVTPYLGGTRVPLFVSWPGHFPGGVDVDALTAQIDIFPTFAELTGARIPENLKLDGRSLVPLLRDKNAAWPDRTLFTHVGRWDKGKADESKYVLCSVRTSQYHLVQASKKDIVWQLFDVKADYGEQTDLAAKRPDVVRDLRGRLDRWWDETRPGLVNEDAAGPRYNPFHVLYWKQFGGGPKDAK